MGVEPTTSWSPVGQRIQLSHRGRHAYIIVSLISMAQLIINIFYGNLRWIYALSGEAALLNSAPSKNKSTLKGKYLLFPGSKFFPF